MNLVKINQLRAISLRSFSIYSKLSAGTGGGYGGSDPGINAPNTGLFGDKGNKEQKGEQGQHVQSPKDQTAKASLQGDTIGYDTTTAPKYNKSDASTDKMEFEKAKRSFKNAEEEIQHHRDRIKNHEKKIQELMDKGNSKDLI